MESNLEKYSWRAAAVPAFLPVVPIFIPFQIGMFIFFSLIFIFMFGMSAKWGLMIAYIGQALVIMTAGHWLLTKSAGLLHLG